MCLKYKTRHLWRENAAFGNGAQADRDSFFLFFAAFCLRAHLQLACLQRVSCPPGEEVGGGIKLMKKVQSRHDDDDINVTEQTMKQHRVRCLMSSCI